MTVSVILVIAFIVALAVIAFSVILLSRQYQYSKARASKLPRGIAPVTTGGRNLVPLVEGRIDTSGGSPKLRLTLFNDFSKVLIIDFDVDRWYWKSPSATDRSPFNIPSAAGKVEINPGHQWSSEVPLTGGLSSISQGDELIFEMNERGMLLYQISIIS